MDLFSDTRASLKRLFLLRCIAIAGQLAAISIAVQLFGIALPVGPMLAIVLALAALNGQTWWQLRNAPEVSHRGLLAELLADVAALTALLYLSGGSTNPFVSLYLLPLSIAAIALPRPHAWVLAAITMTCYSTLMFFYRPLVDEHAMHGSSFNLHVLGMWLNFLVSAVLITAFVTGMTLSIRRRDRQLAEARERALRDEQVLALGTFAAGAAHELGTPLSTIAVLTRELERDAGTGPALREDLKLLRTQVDECKRILTDLTEAAGLARSAAAGIQDAEAFLRGVVGRWSLVRPQVTPSLSFVGMGPAPEIVGEETVRQTLVSILNNAADASPQEVEVEGRWDQEAFTIEVRDRGPGLSAEDASRAGRTPFTTKSDGRGIGLLLANAAIERLGGRVTLFNRDGGGNSTRVQLPLARHGTPA